ncbi:MAG: flagellin, partial [Rubritepida sp.]|nr:flagellin [Rubritepida sp.]
MSLNSVNTNIGAMVALQALNRTGSELAEVQKRISTGFRVADARDDGGAFAVAERVRSDIAANAAANQQLGGVKGLLDVGRAGLQNISNTLKDVRTTVIRLADANVTASARDQYEVALKQQLLAIKNFITDAKYNGQT